jgi:hypothetical protein
VNAHPSPTNFYLKLLKIILFKPFGPAPVIFGALTVLGAVISLFSPDLLGTLNWLLWGVPLAFFLLFFLLGIVWAPWILHQERSEGVSKKIEPPKVRISTRIEEPLQVEREPTRLKERAPVERGLEATSLEKPFQAQREVPATREEPFKVETFSDPLLRQMEDHFERQGEAVAYPRLSERQEYLAKGFQIAYKPGTGQEVWITHSSGDHIMMLKPR